MRLSGRIHFFLQKTKKSFLLHAIFIILLHLLNKKNIFVELTKMKDHEENETLLLFVGLLYACP